MSDRERKRFLRFSRRDRESCNWLISFFLPIEAFVPLSISGVEAVRAKMEWKYGSLEGLNAHIVETGVYRHVVRIAEIDVYHIRFWRWLASAPQEEAENLCRKHLPAPLDPPSALNPAMISHTQVESHQSRRSRA